jgi:hypothetical protein
MDDLNTPAMTVYMDGLPASLMLIYMRKWHHSLKIIDLNINNFQLKI